VEIGTLEQINVTPIKKYQFIMGKLFPFWAFRLILTVGLTMARLVFNIPIIGSWIDLLYLSLSLGYSGIGLFISNYTNATASYVL
jgi:ABC-2 type transport system permease protein